VERGRKGEKEDLHRIGRDTIGEKKKDERMRPRFRIERGPDEFDPTSEESTEKKEKEPKDPT